jgi:hypothetical protein
MWCKKKTRSAPRYARQGLLIQIVSGCVPRSRSPAAAKGSAAKAGGATSGGTGGDTVCVCACVCV